MATNILIPFYSSYGHLHKMAHAVAEGAASVEGAEVKVARIPELEAARQAMSGQDAYVQAQKEIAEHPEVTHDDLRWADGIIWGTPTRFGNMAAQMKAFIDTTGSHWANGELTDKATGIFVGYGDDRRRSGNDRSDQHDSDAPSGDDFGRLTLQPKPGAVYDRRARRLTLRPRYARGWGRLETTRRKRTQHGPQTRRSGCQSRSWPQTPARLNLPACSANQPNRRGVTHRALSLPVCTVN